MSDWTVKYVTASLKKLLKQSRGEIDTKCLLPTSLAQLDGYFQRKVSMLVRVKEGGLECYFCGRLFKSRKGIYIHLTRKHAEELAEYAVRLLSEVEEAVKRAGSYDILLKLEEGSG